jgi:hypothetical protein
VAEPYFFVFLGIVKIGGVGVPLLPRCHQSDIKMTCEGAIDAQCTDNIS